MVNNQWGKSHLGDINSDNKEIGIDFPISYMTLPFAINISCFNADADAANSYNLYAKNVSINRFNVLGDEWGPVVQDISVYWISVGK